MALAFLDNIDYKGKKPDVERQVVNLKSDFLTLSENYYPDMYLAFCLEDRNIYTLDKSRTPNADTGKWEVFNGSGESVETITNPDGTTTKKTEICGIPMESTYDVDGTLLSSTLGNLIVYGEESEPDTGDIDDFFGGLDW